MNLEKLVVVSGLPGVHKIVNTRSNGLIIHDTIENRSRFVPMRANQFTALGTVSVYTDADVDSIPLGDVWQKIFDNLETVPLVPQSASSAEFRAYFSKVMPEHDHDRVHINDIKKCLKWFAFAFEKGLLKTDKVEEKTDEAAIETPVETTEKTETESAKHGLVL